MPTAPKDFRLTLIVLLVGMVGVLAGIRVYGFYRSKQLPSVGLNIVGYSNVVLTASNTWDSDLIGNWIVASIEITNSSRYSISIVDWRRYVRAKGFTPAGAEYGVLNRAPFPYLLLRPGAVHRFEALVPDSSTNWICRIPIQMASIRQAAYRAVNEADIDYRISSVLIYGIRFLSNEAGPIHEVVSEPMAIPSALQQN